MIFTFYIYVGDLLDCRWNHVEPCRRPYMWYFYRPEHHKLWGSWWIPTPSLVELYGSSTQECGVDRGAESSDTSSLNERLGIFLREKDLRRVIAPSRFVGWPPLYIVKGKLKTRSAESNLLPTIKRGSNNDAGTIICRYLKISTKVPYRNTPSQLWLLVEVTCRT